VCESVALELEAPFGALDTASALGTALGGALPRRPGVCMKGDACDAFAALFASSFVVRCAECEGRECEGTECEGTECEGTECLGSVVSAAAASTAAASAAAVAAASAAAAAAGLTLDTDTAPRKISACDGNCVFASHCALVAFAFRTHA
jgi:hypothetical protein